MFPVKAFGVVLWHGFLTGNKLISKQRCAAAEQHHPGTLKHLDVGAACQQDRFRPFHIRKRRSHTAGKVGAGFSGRLFQSPDFIAAIGFKNKLPILCNHTEQGAFIIDFGSYIAFHNAFHTETHFG